MPAPEAAAIADAYGAKWDDDYGHYVVDCGVKATMELTIGQHKYTISTENFVVVDYDGVEYVAEVTIGTPEQKFRVIMDTGSASFYIPDVSCQRYRPKACDNSKCDAGRELFLKVFYSGIPTYPPLDAEGFLGNDTVRLGDPGSEQLVVLGTVFGQAAKFSSSFAGNGIDGVLGLAFPVIASSRITPPISRAIQLHLLDLPLFTVYLRTGKKDVDGGTITFGAVDTTRCGPVIAYEPLTTPTHWQFQWDKHFQHYVVECASKPTLELTIGQHNYTIESQNLVVQIPDGRCILALKPSPRQKHGKIWILG
ncbi:eukaryotic aspartyl protease, partial [Teladorsagia circumcincta]